MSILNLELKNISGIESSIKSTVSELNKRKSDYEGIIKNVSNISSSSGNLSDCNVYLRKKNSELQDKINKLNSFKTKLTTFSSNAKAADTRVSTYITDESNTFYKTVGIKTGWKAGWQSFKKGVKTVWKTVTDFYEKHKYVIDFVVDLALLAVALVSLIAAIPTGGATLFFAGFALAQAIGDMTTSSIALGYHIAGDNDKAGVWAERGLKDGVKLVGHGIDIVVEAISGKQTEIFSNLFGFAYDITCVASLGYGLFKAGKGLVKPIKNKNYKKITTKGIKAILGIDLKPGASKEGYKAIAKAFTFIKNGKQAYNLVRVTGYIKNVKTICYMSNSIYKGTFMSDGIKAVKDIKSIFKNLKSSTREFTMMDYAYWGWIIN